MACCRLTSRGNDDVAGCAASPLGKATGTRAPAFWRLVSLAISHASRARNNSTAEILVFPSRGSARALFPGSRLCAVEEMRKDGKAVSKDCRQHVAQEVTAGPRSKDGSSPCTLSPEIEEPNLGTPGARRKCSKMSHETRALQGALKNSCRKESALDAERGGRKTISQSLELDFSQSSGTLTCRRVRCTIWGGINSGPPDGKRSLHSTA
jgi:hypothetical protein